MKLQKKTDKIKKIENYDFFVESYVEIAQTEFYEITFALFELKEAICRLNEYLYYSDKNPFFENVPYVKYSRFIYESYLNDTYIIQTRFRKLINVIKCEKRFTITEEEKDDIEDKFKVVVAKLRKITKEIRGEHVHDKRYNDKDFMICDSMERMNNLFQKINGTPIKEFEGVDLYQSVAVSHLDDVQNLILNNNNYIYASIDLFLKEITDLIINKINFYISENKR